MIQKAIHQLVERADLDFDTTKAVMDEIMSGINVIWLSPVYQSPNDDNGYDISDYQAIMKEFGTMEDFDRMLEEAHTRGIKIVMDLVVNHTSDEHAWFMESKKSKDNPYRDYYIWREGKDGKEPNNWGSVFNGPAWEYDGNTDMYYLHMFSKKQPDLNWENPKVRDEVFSMMNWWCEKGIDGFRMDVISMISKAEGLPDGEVRDGLHGDASPYVQNGPHVHEYLQEMNQRVLSKYDLLTVGECAGVTIGEAKRYASEKGTELNMVFQFEQNVLDCGPERYSYRKVPLPELKACFTKWQTVLQDKAWNSLYWTNHDQPRTVSRRGNDKEFRKESQKMLYTMLLTMQGTPYIYQGEEIGMTNVHFDSIEDYNDIEVKNLWKERVVNGDADPEVLLDAIRFRSRDNARTPMQWDDSQHAGFTVGTPWLKVNPNYKEINVKEALEDPDSIFYYMKRLIRMRKANEVAVYGDFREYEPENESLYIYERNYEGKKMFVVLNFTEHEVPFRVPEGLNTGGAALLIDNYKGDAALEDRMMRPYEAAVYVM